MMTRAIAALIKIMSDQEAPLRRRIEATAGLLDYEAPADAVELAKAFLTEVFEDPDQDVNFKLDALKLIRKAEAAKIIRPTAGPADDPANREAWRRLEIGRRRIALIKSGAWPPPPDWADDLQSQDYRAPIGARDITDTANLGERMKVARLAAPAKSSVR